MRMLAAISVMVAVVATTSLSPAQEATPLQNFQHAVSPFLAEFCVSCHGAKKAEAELSLDRFAQTPRTPTELATWKKVFEQLESRAMPPADAAQPSVAARLQVMEWIRRSLKAAGAPVDESKARASARGNWVDHATLFSGQPVFPGQPASDAATPARVWRITDDAYDAFIKRLSIQGAKLGDITPPWKLPTQWSFADYAAAHRVGEPEIEVHLRASTRIAKHWVSLLSKHKQYAPLAAVANAGAEATPEQLQAAVAFGFQTLLAREPDAQEQERYGKFLVHGVKTSGGLRGVEQFLIVLLSHPAVLYRIEKPAGDAPRGPPPPQDLARSISFALTDREPDPMLARAVAQGEFTNRDDVRKQVTRILADDSIAKPRIVRFIRDYFGYDVAPEVFKDQATQKAHGISEWEPTFFVTDADRLVAWILAADKNVLRELLTTNKTFVLTSDPRRPLKAARYHNERFGRSPPETPFKSGTSVLGVLSVYELKFATRGDWSADRPFDLPPDHRLGLLTHPAWLVAQSGNFDNHAIHRGRWIRERLLGGVIPDVPITVNAMLPDEPHRTLRERMQVVRDEYCWNCHKQMDPLGLPFEQFDHFGRFRTKELVVDNEATAAKANLDKNGQPKRNLYKEVPLDTSGHVAGSLDPRLNGPVENPFELIRKLADSEIVEQVFVRHAFRFFLGRNETLADGPVLIAAHRAYRENGGSLRAMLTSLLTSDAFLIRRHTFE